MLLESRGPQMSGKLEAEVTGSRVCDSVDLGPERSLSASLPILTALCHPSCHDGPGLLRVVGSLSHARMWAC